MSQENVEIVRRIAETFLSGNYDEAFALVDPEVEFDVSIRPEGKVYRGRDGMLEAAQTWTNTWDDWRLDIEELIDAGEQIVMVDRQWGKGRDSGVPLSQQTAWVCTIRDGKLVRMVWFPTREAALKAVGLT